jgi:hypothetical protein
MHLRLFYDNDVHIYFDVTKQMLEGFVMRCGLQLRISLERLGILLLQLSRHLNNFFSSVAHPLRPNPLG